MQASAKVVDLMLGKMAEEADSARPVATVQHVLVHQFLCVRCREQQLVDDATLPLWTPPSASAAFTPAKRASAWGDDPEGPPEPAPAPKPPEPRMIAIPKLPGQGGRRERDRDSTPIVKGLA